LRRIGAGRGSAAGGDASRAAGGPLPRMRRVTAMGDVTCHRWCRAGGNLSGPEPSIAVLNDMLDELSRLLADTGTHAIAMDTQSWRRPEGIADTGDNDFLAQIRLKVTDEGMATRSFRSWFQWWHPRWVWPPLPFPEKLLLASSLDPLQGAGEAGAQH
jgi:hypothetical protein